MGLIGRLWNINLRGTWATKVYSCKSETGKAKGMKCFVSFAKLAELIAQEQTWKHMLHLSLQYFLHKCGFAG